MALGETSRTEHVDIDELESYMARELANYRLQKSGQETKLFMIFRVQKHIKEVDSLSFEPMVVSVGPYYHGNSSLLFMERVKWKCLDYVLKLNRRQKLEDYLKAMEGLEKQARSCYSEHVMLESDRFLQMLLLDGCFILMYLGGTVGLDPNQSLQEKTKDHGVHNGRRTEITRSSNDASNLGSMKDEIMSTFSDDQHQEYEIYSHSERDPILKWYDSRAFRDLFLIENQLPFFIVTRIYELLVGLDVGDHLIQKVCKCLEYNIKKYTTVIHDVKGKDVCHLLQLCHMYFRPQKRKQKLFGTRNTKKWFHRIAIFRQKNVELSCSSEDISLNHQSCSVDSRQALYSWHRAEEYHEAGIEFRSRGHNEHDSHSLLDISFDNGEIEIPSLLLDENTACFFRNLVAFEQTCPQFGNDFTAYIAFISQLVRTPRDVALLARKGIIVNHMRTDDEVSTLFTKLGKNVDFDLNGSYYLKSVCRMMEEYYQNRINRWMAWLWHNHFGNPWLVLAVVAAAVVLFCTILQLLFALLAYLDLTKDANEAANHGG